MATDKFGTLSIAKLEYSEIYQTWKFQLTIIFTRVLYVLVDGIDEKTYGKEWARSII